MAIEQRETGAMETAQVITGLHNPFNISAVVKISNGPSIDRLTNALDRLLKKHPILGTRIENEKDPFEFHFSSPNRIICNRVPRENENTWFRTTEQQLSHQFEIKTGPLVKVDYVSNEDFSGDAEIIFTFHHAIVDAASCANLIDEVFRFCVSDISAELSSTEPNAEIEEAAEKFFPDNFQGIRRKINCSLYMMRMMFDEFTYFYKTRKRRIPPIHASGSIRIIPIVLSKELSTSIWKQARKKRVTIKNLFDAVLVRVIHQTVYEGEKIPLRFFTFADLRPFLKPAMPHTTTGSYFAMLRYTTNMNSSQTLLEQTRKIQDQVYHSFKRGDKFSANLLSPSIMKMLLKFKKFRMGTTAVSYTGPLEIKQKYGNIKINRVHAFTSNFPLGPEYTAQTRLFNDQFYWDILYLDSDMDEVKANQIAEKIMLTLESFTKEGK